MLSRIHCKCIRWAWPPFKHHKCHQLVQSQPTINLWASSRFSAFLISIDFLYNILQPILQMSHRVKFALDQNQSNGKTEVKSSAPQVTPLRVNGVNALQRSKSLSSADTLARGIASLGLTVGTEANDIGTFKTEIQAVIDQALIDPNQLNARSLMELANQIIQRAVEGRRCVNEDIYFVILELIFESSISDTLCRRLVFAFRSLRKSKKKRSSRHCSTHAVSGIRSATKFLARHNRSKVLLHGHDSLRLWHFSRKCFVSWNAANYNCVRNVTVYRRHSFC